MVDYKEILGEKPRMLDIIKRFAAKSRITYKIIYFMYIVFEWVNKAIFFILRIFPIKEDKIVFCTVRGKRYGDNPLYISEELKKRKKEYDIVWLLNKELKKELPKDIRFVKYNYFTEVYHLATAKVWVDTNMKFCGVLKRRGQLYVQTWHGSYGIKKIAKDLEEKLPLIDRRYYDYNAKIIDLMVSNSKKTTEIYRRAFGYEGEMLQIGSPRNDIFFGSSSENITKVKKYFDIAEQKVVLYAPTFRKGYSTDELNLDYEKLLQALSIRYGGEWILLIRLHPYNLKESETWIKYSSTMKNASVYPNMEDLLVTADILVTDYSSCMFDFVTTGKCCFLYATDVEEYRNDRDYYFDIKELPFPLAENNEQLEKNILNFNEEIYQKKLNELFEQVGLCETGHASEKVADYIEQWMKEN